VAKRILTAEFREQQLERAKVLRVLMRHVIADMDEETSEAPLGQKRRVFQRVVAAVRITERQKPKGRTRRRATSAISGGQRKGKQPYRVSVQVKLVVGAVRKCRRCGRPAQ
jgi:hypothetical protein